MRMLRRCNRKVGLAVDVSMVGIEPLERELESVIGRVRAVAAARVVVNSEGSVEAIHVLATGGRTSEQIAADIEAVCAAMFNVHLERRQIRISQLDDEARRLHAGRRPLLEMYSLTVESARHICRICVKLRSGDGLYEGAAHGADALSVRPRLAASAALEAIAQFQEEAVRQGANVDAIPLSLHNLQPIDVGPHQAMVAAVVAGARFSGTAAEQWLVGCALVEKDLPDAAVRAVLDAVNRSILDTVTA